MGENDPLAPVHSFVGAVVEVDATLGVLGVGLDGLVHDFPCHAPNVIPVFLLAHGLLLGCAVQPAPPLRRDYLTLNEVSSSL